MLAINRDLEMHKNFYSLDVRIHQRIWDVYKHLLRALNKLTKNTIKIYCMDLAVQQRVEYVENFISIDVGNEQRLRDARKVLFIRC